MAKEFIIDDRRHVHVRKQNNEFTVTIEEPGVVNKSVTLPAKRWAALVACESTIDEYVRRFQAGEIVEFKSHIGGSYYVSITTGYPCVDIREFYFDKTRGGPRASKHGIALNLTQWPLLKEVNLLIKQQFPKLAKAELCAHLDMNSLMNCTECTPFLKAPPSFY